MDDLPHLLVFDNWIVKDIDYRIQFEDDLLEPEFIRLMRNNEQHLVMCRLTHQLTFELLGSKQFVKLQVVAVINLFRSSGHLYQASPPGCATGAGV